MSEEKMQFVLITGHRYWVLSLKVESDRAAFETSTEISNTHFFLKWRVLRAVKRLTNQWLALRDLPKEVVRIVSI